MQKELISVVVPVYKVENYLDKCIKSIRMQTYKNLEIILVNDGSPDKCGQLCDEYKKKDKRIKVIHQENGGLSAARNTGIVNSTGKYITFIDSDDYIDEKYIEELYSVLVHYKADMAIVSHRVLYEKTCINKATGKKFLANSKEILEKILYDDGIDLSTWAKLYKKKLFNNIEFPVGRLFEDAATTYKLVAASKRIAVNSIPLYNYVIRENSISTNSFSEKKLDLITSTKEMTTYIEKKYPDLKDGCKRRLMYSYLSTLTQFVKSNSTNKKIKNQLVNYIKENRRVILKDRRAPKRDKIAVYSLIIGYPMYKFVWNTYSKITGRK